MIPQGRQHPKLICNPQTLMTPFLKIKMQGDDLEKVRRNVPGMLAELATDSGQFDCIDLKDGKD